VAGEQWQIALHLGSAWAAGSLLGLERSFHGRPAGFRTHALVCLASALLMLVSSRQWPWLEGAPLATIQTDPTRMAAGIMTGIGFLGAGVIFKERLSVRGLTTAASIWFTAALGILYGIGLFYPALLATGAALGTLALFRWLEVLLPSQLFALLILRYPRAEAPDEAAVRQLVGEFRCRISGMSYALDGARYEYRMMIKTYGRSNFQRLAAQLLREPGLAEFSLAPTGD
jgi:putative Mg2+ transporter-C (MgtC) family protein